MNPCPCQMVQMHTSDRTRISFVLLPGAHTTPTSLQDKCRFYLHMWSCHFPPPTLWLLDVWGTSAFRWVCLAQLKPDCGAKSHLSGGPFTFPPLSCLPFRPSYWSFACARVTFRLHRACLTQTESCLKPKRFKQNQPTSTLQISLSKNHSFAHIPPLACHLARRSCHLIPSGWSVRCRWFRNLFWCLLSNWPWCCW